MGHVGRLTLLAFPTGLTLAQPGILWWGIKTFNRLLKFKTFSAVYCYVCIYTWVGTVTVARAWSMKITQKNKVFGVTSSVFLVLKLASYQAQQNKVQFLIRQFHKAILPLKTILHHSLSQLHYKWLAIASLSGVSSNLPDATKRITESLCSTLLLSRKRHCLWYPFWYKPKLGLWK